MLLSSLVIRFLLTSVTQPFLLTFRLLVRAATIAGRVARITAAAVFMIVALAASPTSLAKSLGWFLRLSLVHKLDFTLSFVLVLSGLSKLKTFSKELFSLDLLHLVNGDRVRLILEEVL